MEKSAPTTWWCWKDDQKPGFPPYQIAPIVSQAALDSKNPGIADALNQLSPLLNDGVRCASSITKSAATSETKTNQKTKKEPAEVAREMLILKVDSGSNRGSKPHERHPV